VPGRVIQLSLNSHVNGSNALNNKGNKNVNMDDPARDVGINHVDISSMTSKFVGNVVADIVLPVAKKGELGRSNV